MDPDSGTVLGCTGDSDFEFAWQPFEFRVRGRPLPQQFAKGSWVNLLVRCSAGELVRGDVSDTASAGLNRMHVHIG